MLSYLFTFCLCLRQNAFHCFSLVFMSSQFRTRYHKLFMALVVLASPLLDHRLTISLSHEFTHAGLPLHPGAVCSVAKHCDANGYSSVACVCRNSPGFKQLGWVKEHFLASHMEICTKNLPVVGIRFRKRLIRV